MYHILNIYAFVFSYPRNEMVKSIMMVLTKKEKTVVADTNVVVRWML
jgi:hypothetical protein